MTDDQTGGLPAPIVSGLAGIPAALVPSCVKALNRLITAAIDIPAAKLRQYAAKIDAQTASFSEVEAAVARTAAERAAASSDIAERAVETLVRASYRKQINRESVAQAALEDLGEREAPSRAEPPPQDIDDDWLNVFEQHAERASTERMQKLWGRVLAGEIRGPGRYSMRTLRFLSEFSQKDAMDFVAVAQFAFAGSIPKEAILKDPSADIRHLLDMEAAGLLSGATGMGLTLSFSLQKSGASTLAILADPPLRLALEGDAEVTISMNAITLTPLALELLDLIPGRDAVAAAASFVAALPKDQLLRATLLVESTNAAPVPVGVLWERPSDPGANG